MRKTLAYALVIPPLLLGMACGGGTSAPPANDLQVTGLRVVSTEPQLGHVLDAEISVSAEATTHDVHVLFFLVREADVDAGDPSPDLYVLACEDCETVFEGEAVYPARLMIATHGVPPGSYYLVAVIDPLDAVPESNEENNEFTAAEVKDVGVLVDITDNDVPDLVLRSISVDDPVVELPLDPAVYDPVDGNADVPNTEFGITALVELVGAEQSAGVMLGAFLDVPGYGRLPLDIWDSSLGAYVKRVAISSLQEDEPTALRLDVRVPQDAVDLIADYLGFTDGETPFAPFDVIVEVDPDDQIPEHEDAAILVADEDGNDNAETARLLFSCEEEEPMQGLRVAAAQGPNELDWDIPFISDFSNDKVGIGLKFGAKATVGKHGVLGVAKASAPLTVLGQQVELLALDAKGLYNPKHKEDNGFVVTLSALYGTVYEKRVNEDKDRWNDNGLSFAKTYKTTQSFAVGPVPVTVEIGATGKLGMDIAASVGHDFEVFAEPFLDFKVYGEGGVGGGLAGWKLGAGVGAEMSLVKEKFHAGITATVDFDQESSVLTATVTEQVSNDLAGPTGRLYLWATAKGKILWATINKKWEYTLVKWESFRKEDTLFERTQAVSCELP